MSRREGKDLFGTGGESLQRRLDQPPGQHGKQPVNKQTEYARQLREKQKVKRMYGMREAQFLRFFKIAQKSRGITGVALLRLLERRLDNVVYRLGFTRSRLQARQLVSHGHIYVDDHRVSIPSYLVAPGQEVKLSPKALQMPDVIEMVEGPRNIPGWLETADGGGRMLREPEREEIDQDINERAIVEFYSR
jgi:small subunit ribosomal protein S4